MRVSARAAAAAAAAVLLAAGCGSVRYQGAASRPGRPAATGPPTISQQQAVGLARALLGRAILPPGARARAGRPPAALAEAPAQQAGSPSVALHRLWTVGQPVSWAYAFAERHVPAGMAWASSGQGGDWGTVTEESVSFGLGRLPAGVAAASLTMTVAPAGAGASVIRADAQVIWFPPRSAAESVPAAAHAVTVTASPLGPGPRRVTQTVTSPAVVRRLAAMLDGVHAAPAGSFISCPMERVSYHLAFARSPGAAPYLTVAATTCPVVWVTVRGQQQPALQMPAGLQGLLGSLTGVPMFGGTAAMRK